MSERTQPSEPASEPPDVGYWWTFDGLPPDSDRALVVYGYRRGDRVMVNLERVYPRWRVVMPGQTVGLEWSYVRTIELRD